MPNRGQPTLDFVGLGLSSPLRDLSGSRCANETGFFIARIGRVEWQVEAESLTSRVGGNIPIGISFGDQFLAPGVDQKSNEIGAAVVTTVVVNSLGNVSLVEINLRVNFVSNPRSPR